MGSETGWHLPPVWTSTMSTQTSMPHLTNVAFRYMVPPISRISGTSMIRTLLTGFSTAWTNVRDI